MYHYTQEQLESMKKVEASRASRIEKLHERMTAFRLLKKERLKTLLFYILCR